MKAEKTIAMKTFLIGMVFCCTANLLAQNKPVSQTQVAGPAGQVKATPANYSGLEPLNYVRTWDALKPFSTPQQLVAAGYVDAKQSTIYLDGLGRPIQTVARQASPGNSPRDLVAPVLYDDYSREVFK